MKLNQQMKEYIPDVLSSIPQILLKNVDSNSNYCTTMYAQNNRCS